MLRCFPSLQASRCLPFLVCSTSFALRPTRALLVIGTVKMWDNQKRMGFVVSDATDQQRDHGEPLPAVVRDKDLIFARGDLETHRSLTPGQRVEYDLTERNVDDNSNKSNNIYIHKSTSSSNTKSTNAVRKDLHSKFTINLRARRVTSVGGAALPPGPLPGRLEKRFRADTSSAAPSSRPNEDRKEAPPFRPASELIGKKDLHGIVWEINRKVGSGFVRLADDVEVEDVRFFFPREQQRQQQESEGSNNNNESPLVVEHGDAVCCDIVLREEENSSASESSTVVGEKKTRAKAVNLRKVDSQQAVADKLLVTESDEVRAPELLFGLKDQTGVVVSVGKKFVHVQARGFPSAKLFCHFDDLVAGGATSVSIGTQVRFDIVENPRRAGVARAVNVKIL